MPEIPEHLIDLHRRNGYTRKPNPNRRASEKARYKKGWELRLVLNNEKELSEVRRLLRRAGIKPSRSFKKSKQWVQPIYGEKTVNAFEAATR